MRMTLADDMFDRLDRKSEPDSQAGKVGPDRERGG